LRKGQWRVNLQASWNYPRLFISTAIHFKLYQFAFFEKFLSESAVIVIMVNQTKEKPKPTIQIVDNEVLSRKFIRN